VAVTLPGVTLRTIARVVAGLPVLLLAACAIKTPGTPTAAPADLASTPPIPGPRWKSPDPFDPEAWQPRGFAVLDPDRRPLFLERRPDGTDSELWRPSGPLATSAFAMIDESRIAAIEPWIAVLELADDDAVRHPEVPPRRAVDGLLARPTESPPCGLAIVLGSLARLNPPEQWLVAEFLMRGWTVLVSSPPICAPDDDTNGVTTLSPGLEPELAGRTLAAEVDAGLGTWRGGLRDILARLETRNDLPNGPTVLVGASSGALAAALVADSLRTVRRIDAVVMIAGGASPAEILARTTLADQDLRVDRQGPRVHDVDLPRFVRAFESATCLQSPAAESSAAARLDGTPVLMLEAGFDSAIPETARRRLRSLFPHADHWWYPLGHYGLFFALSTESGPIVDWIERVIPR
jgi:dienelactone hydrolase